MKRLIVYGTILMLIAASFLLFGIQLNQLLEEKTPITTIAEAVNFDDGSIGIDSNSDGIGHQGKISFLGTDIVYDTIYDDDTTGDGYKDRRSYYLDNQMVFASWDENGDWLYETSMRIAEGMYVSAEVTDTDGDGLIDTLTTFSNEGEELSVKSDLINGDGSEFMGISDDKSMSTEAILWLAIPLLSGLLFLVVLIVLVGKSKKGNKIISLMLCVIMMSSTLIVPGYASELYDEDGIINQEVFEKDWLKYSDIDHRIPLDQRSYEAKSYGQAQQKIQSLYTLIYQTTVNQELNRLSYVDLANYKKAVDTTQKYNLIKSTIRLAAFTGYTVKDSIGKGKSFAENILKSGATLVTQIGDVMTVTSDFVTDSYKESFETLEKVFKYTTSDNIAEDILEDMKSEVKDQVSIKINDTIDEAIGRKRIPDYTVDDLKISDADVQLLKAHYDKSRELDNAILQNRKVHKKYQNQIDAAVWEILSEMKKLDAFRVAEKERVYYILSQNPPENEVDDEDDPFGLLGESAPEDWEEGASDTDYSWLDGIEIEDIDSNTDEQPIEDPFEEEEENNTDQLVGVWYGTATISEYNITRSSEVITEETRAALNSMIGQPIDLSITIYKEEGTCIFKYGDILMPIERKGNKVYLDRGNLHDISNGFDTRIVADLSGYVNDVGNEMVLDTVLGGSSDSEASSGTLYFTMQMVLTKN